MSSKNIETFFDYDRLKKEITDPEPLTAYIKILNQLDREKIAAETKGHGPSRGVLELCNRITKRGPKAVPQFIDALEKCEHRDLAENLKAIATDLKLLDPGVSLDETEPPVVAREIARSINVQESVPVLSNPIAIEEASHASHSLTVHPHTEPDNSSVYDASNHVDKRNKASNAGPETRLKDVPSKLKYKIVSCLNVDSAMGNNWRGLAGEAGFTVEDEGKLRSSSSPMEEMFTWMVQKHLCVSDLIKMLKKQERDDVINIIDEYGYAELETSLPSSSQNSKTDFKESSVKKESNKKESDKLSEEASDKIDDEEGVSGQLSDIPEDNVFLPEKLEGKALFIGVETYKHMTSLSKLNKDVNQLSAVFEWMDGWQVFKTSKKECLSAKMKKEVCSYLDNIEKNDVCLLYLAGHTVQINGQNYLLASETDANCTAADLIECSININNLLTELTRHQPLMILLFVDGAHTNDAEFSSCGALTGLAPMFPPPNAVIAFPCRPGHTRPENERLLYVAAVKGILEEQENITPSTLFAALKQKIPSSMVFSLSRSLLPLYIHTTHEEHGEIAIRKPLSDSPRLAFIFYDDMNKKLKEHLLNDTEHLKASLQQLGWTVAVRPRSEHQDTKQTIRDTLRDLNGDEIKVVMLYFMGFEAADIHSLSVGAQSISISWLVNLMCEYVCGPKALVVDDSRPHVPQSLELVTPLPQEVLLSLPKEKKMENKSPTRDSFTLLLAQNLAILPDRRFHDVFSATVLKWKHQQMESNLFYA